MKPKKKSKNLLSILVFMIKISTENDNSKIYTNHTGYVIEKYRKMVEIAPNFKLLAPNSSGRRPEFVAAKFSYIFLIHLFFIRNHFIRNLFLRRNSHALLSALSPR